MYKQGTTSCKQIRDTHKRCLEKCNYVCDVIALLEMEMELYTNLVQMFRNYTICNIHNYFNILTYINIITFAEVKLYTLAEI